MDQSPGYEDVCNANDKGYKEKDTTKQAKAAYCTVKVQAEYRQVVDVVLLHGQEDDTPIKAYDSCRRSRGNPKPCIRNP